MPIKNETLDLLDMMWVIFIVLIFSSALMVGIAIGMTEIEIHELRSTK